LVAQRLKNATRPQICLAKSRRMIQSLKREKDHQPPQPMVPSLPVTAKSPQPSSRPGARGTEIANHTTFFVDDSLWPKITPHTGHGNENGNCYHQSSAKKEVVERGRVPLELANHMVRIASDTSITSMVQIHVAAHLVRHAGNDYTVPPDAAAPKIIAAELGYNPSLVYRALNGLHERGYIEWRRASGAERHSGKSGSIRILIPSTPPQS
jgi:hypothetical protein